MRRPSVARGPGLFLDDEIALDGEDAAALAQLEQVDQVGIDVELVAILAEATGDAEAEPLGSIGHAKGRVETRRDEATVAGRTALSET
jgi:hypothetical protein